MRRASRDEYLQQLVVRHRRPRRPAAYGSGSGSGTRAAAERVRGEAQSPATSERYLLRAQQAARAARRSASEHALPPRRQLSFDRMGLFLERMHIASLRKESPVASGIPWNVQRLQGCPARSEVPRKQ